ncbi:MAG TPA: helix-turn-helix domain-containing protein [Polyangia bacterium]|nr:helix-turn-helix domain-containing protein [Polyangia bacterium]
MKVAAQKKKVARPMACDCGGHLHPAKLASYDFSKYVGFKVTLTGMDGLKCDKCGWETIDGHAINLAMDHMVVTFAGFPRRLNGIEASYFRRRLGVTQEELASRMGIVRETVAKWECGDQVISPQHDFILRVLSLTRMIAAGRISRNYAEKIMAEIRAVRSDPPEESSPISLSGIDAMKIAGTPARAHERRQAAG